jgi:hypothetical protein
MNQEFLKEAKNFRMQMKWCSIICWISTAIFVYGWFNGNKNIQEDLSWLIVPIGAIILTGIYFNMNKNIKRYEQISK